MSAALLACRGLDIACGGRTLVKALDLEVSGGQMVAVLGRNGAGKTTTLLTLAGLRPPSSGEITLDGRELPALPRGAVARRLALLSQTDDDAFPATVLETAMIGRHPHIPFWGWESATDRELARAALASVGLDGFERRLACTLSGGERRRLSVATVLAQDAALYLLDEPVNHLDPHHQLSVLGMFSTVVAHGRGVVVSLHEPNLAARFCTHALLLFGDGSWEFGTLAQVMTADALSRAYATPLESVSWRDGTLFVAVPG